MSRTFRSDENYERKARDGKGRYRGCGDKHCSWCISNRKLKVILK